MRCNFSCATWHGGLTAVTLLNRRNRLLHRARRSDQPHLLSVYFKCGQITISTPRCIGITPTRGAAVQATPFSPPQDEEANVFVPRYISRDFYGFVTTRLWRTVQLHVQNNSVTALRPLGCLSVCVCVCFSLSCTTRYLGGGACKSGTPEAVAPKAIKEGWPVPLALSLPANTCRLCLRHLKLSLFCSGYGLAAHILCFCK